MQHREICRAEEIALQSRKIPRNQYRSLDLNLPLSVYRNGASVEKSVFLSPFPVRILCTLRNARAEVDDLGSSSKGLTALEFRDTRLRDIVAAPTKVR